MRTATEAQVRPAMIVALAACRTLLETLDRDGLDQRRLRTCLDELCELLEGSLRRN